MIKRIVGLGVSGLLALVVGLVLPHLPDSALSTFTGDTSIQGTAAYCTRPTFRGDVAVTPASVEHFRRSCAAAFDVMNLGAWLVIVGALVLAVAFALLIRGRIRRHPALAAHAV